MSIQRTETDDYYFVRKPHGIPTTFGSHFSFMEEIVRENPPFLAPLAQHFSAQEEYGLLNRLDNDTAGLLYFAKTKNIKEEYKILQDAHKITKLYLAVLDGRVDIQRTAEKHPELLISNDDGITKGQHDAVLSTIIPSFYHSIVCEQLPWAQEEFSKNINKGLTITYPIMHHTHDDIRMVAVRIPKDEHKGRGDKHYVNTTIYPITYNDVKNTTLCLIEIHQGIRHQIRIHASSIGYPVVGDKLYGKQESGELQLWSIGII